MTSLSTPPVAIKIIRQAHLIDVKRLVFHRQTRILHAVLRHKAVIIDHQLSARPLRRAIQNLLEDKLAEAVLDGKIKAGDEVTVTKGEDSLKFLSAEVIKN